MDIYYANKREQLALLALGERGEPAWDATFMVCCRLFAGSDEGEVLALQALAEGDLRERVDAALFLYGRLFYSGEPVDHSYSRREAMPRS